MGSERSSMSPDEAKASADRGLGELHGQLLDRVAAGELPLPRDKALDFIRAAYGKGYTDALSESAPIIREALDREAILSVLVPVP